MNSSFYILLRTSLTHKLTKIVPQLIRFVYPHWWSDEQLQGICSEMYSFNWFVIMFLIKGHLIPSETIPLWYSVKVNLEVDEDEGFMAGEVKKKLARDAKLLSSTQGMSH